MSHLRFATRIALIVVTSVSAVWIGAVVLFLLSEPREANSLPLPARIVAIVELIERTPPDRQSSVIDAVTSDTLLVRIDDGRPLGPSSSRPLMRLGEEALSGYLAVLGGRTLRVVQPSTSARWRWFFPDALEFRIALLTGQTLVLDTRPGSLVTLFGLPVGFGAGCFGTLIALIALYASHRETRPLKRLVDAVDRIDLAQVDHPAAPAWPTFDRSAPEIRALVAAFERLQTRLALLIKARMAMLGGISHDVRTFATRLRLRVDAIADPAQRRRAIGDIDDMIRLLDDALLTSRAAVGELCNELIEVDEVVRGEAADRAGGGAAVTWTIAASARGATMLGDRLAIRRVVANLIDNALKYGRRAAVGVDRTAQSIVLTVDDDGPGIAPDQRALVFEPFTRLESSRDRRTGGAGLGLAVVRSLVESQGGSVAITDAPLRGSRLVVHWPIFEARSGA